MKEGIHPDYRAVAFKDSAAGHTFIIRSTVKTKETLKIDGVEYPAVNLDTSSVSHPFYTGKSKTTEVGGRVSKFKARYGVKTPPAAA